VSWLIHAGFDTAYDDQPPRRPVKVDYSIFRFQSPTINIVSPVFKPGLNPDL
jgi:hypothetical protein